MRVRIRRSVVVVGVVSLVMGLLPGAAIAEDEAETEADVTYDFDSFGALEIDEPSSATITVTADPDAVAGHVPVRLVVTLTGEDGPVADAEVGVRTSADDEFTTVTTDDQGRFFAPADAPWTARESGLTTEDGAQVEVELSLSVGDYRVEAQLAATHENVRDAEVQRLFGDGRVNTAVEVSQDAFSDGADTAYIATGYEFPDALAGGPAAYLEDGPVLLVGTDFLPEETAEELSRLDVDTVRILGGSAAVDANVEAELESYAAIDRFGGAERLETAALIAESIYEPGVDVAYVATGAEPWDALSGGAAGAATEGPVVLAYADELPEVTAEALAYLEPSEIRVLGGTEAINDDVLAGLEEFTAGDVVRMSGETRFDTSANISESTFNPAYTPTAFIATGEEFPDSLTGAPGAGVAGAPMLLVGHGMITPSIEEELTRLGSEGGLSLVVLGGDSAVSDGVVDELSDYVVEADADLDAVTPIGDPGQDDFRIAIDQLRAFWVDAFNEGIYNEAEVETLVADAVAANANALIVQTSRRFDCFCNDAVYPRTHADIDPEPYDPLETMIEKAHAEGLEVHAWVNATTLWNEEDPPPQADHVFNTNGPDQTGRDNWVNTRHDGEQIIGTNSFIDPAHPDAVDYQVEAINSIVENYDVDGINLDYIRYPDHNVDWDDEANPVEGESSWGYGEVSLERFEADTGRTDRPDPDDEQFSNWRRDQVTNMVQRIYLGINEVDPSVALSIDGTSYGFGPAEYGDWEETRPYTEVMQDWRLWMEMGIVDLNVLMNYKRNWEDPPDIVDQDIMFTQWTDFLADNQYERHAVNGPALYLNEIPDSIEQIRETFEPTDDGNTSVGWSGYSYANVSLTATEEGDAGDDPDIQEEEREALIEALTEEDPAGDEPVFSDLARVPDMPWKSNEAHISGAVDASSDGSEAELMLDGEVVATDQVDGSGSFGFVDVEPGDYEVVVDGTTASVTAQIGGVAQVSVD